MIQKQLKTSSAYFLLDHVSSSLDFHKFLQAGTPCSPGQFCPVCPQARPA